MLSPEEKRFVRSWEEQRRGGRWSYYLLYVPVAAFICSLILSIFLYLFFQVTLGAPFLWFVFAGSLTLSLILTLSAWRNNERKFRKIVRREIEEGRIKDREQATDKDPENANP
ncbi:MAG: hypothetical protein JNL51_07210 [Chitinophagaceae bacterium]|nr:hypothetical protein [Chitinophagaceae bacterium]